MPKLPTLLSSKQNLQILRKQINFSHFVFFTSINWNKTHKRFEIDKDSPSFTLKSKIFLFWTIFSFVPFPNAIFQFYNMLYQETESQIVMKLYHAFMTLVYVNGILATSTFQWHSKDFVVLLNNLGRFGLRDRISKPCSLLQLNFKIKR